MQSEIKLVMLSLSKHYQDFHKILIYKTQLEDLDSYEIVLVLRQAQDDNKPG